MSMTIRPAAPRDFARLLPLVAAYYKFDSISFDRVVTGRALRRMLGNRSLGRVWVVEAAGSLAAYAILTYNYDLEFGGVQGIVTDMYVNARYRRKGLGAKLIEAVRSYCSSRGIAAIELQVTAGNRRAQDFYRALGFRKSDRVVMGLEVGPARRKRGLDA